MKLYFTIFIMLFFVILAFVFGSQNDQLITLNYLIAKTSMYVATAVSLFTVIGFILGVFFMLLLKLLKPSQKNKNKG